MYAWLTTFGPRYYWVARVDAGPFDVFTDDLPTHHVLDDQVLDALDIHPIIQSSRTARTWKRRKAAAEAGRPRVRWKNLSDEHIRALGAAPEAALPLELGVLSRTVRLQDSAERIMESGGAAAVAALGTAADQDLETAHHRL